MPKLINDRGDKETRRKLRSAMPPAERILWHHLRSKQLGCKFRRQVSIQNFVVDFYCPSKSLIVEIDGDSHFNRIRRQKDLERDATLRRLAFKVLRFTNSEIYHDLDRVLRDLQTALEATPPLAPPRRGGESSYEL